MATYNEKNLIKENILVVYTRAIKGPSKGSIIEVAYPKTTIEVKH